MIEAGRSAVRTTSSPSPAGLSNCRHSPVGQSGRWPPGVDQVTLAALGRPPDGLHPTRHSEQVFLAVQRILIRPGPSRDGTDHLFVAVE
jgi:hypothetical protein